MKATKKGWEIMRKDDLRSGMIVETRNGDLYLVVGDFMTRENGFDLLLNYDENLKNKVSNKLDIVKVHEYKNDRHGNNATAIRTLFNRELLTLLWERKEYNLTEREVEVLKALQTLGYEWLGRGSNDGLYAFGIKPDKFGFFWTVGANPNTRIYEDVFTFIKWTDDEPTNIKELLK